LNRLFPSLLGVGPVPWPAEKRQTAFVATSLDAVNLELGTRFEVSPAVQDANIESVELVGSRFSAMRATITDACGTGKPEVSGQIETRPSSQG